MRKLAARAQEQATVLFWFVAFLWVLELMDLLVFRRSLDRLGIRPREPDGLPGIFLAPFLHGGLLHLISNTVPLLILGWLVIVRRTFDFFAVTAITMLVGGLGVWLFGRPNSIHLGASGLIFGYIGYVLARGFVERSPASIMLAVIVGLLYGGAIWGVLPGQPGISWEGHLFGFLGGALAGRLLARRG